MKLIVKLRSVWTLPLILVTNQILSTFSWLFESAFDPTEILQILLQNLMDPHLECVLPHRFGEDKKLGVPNEIKFLAEIDFLFA